jgi:NAD(P)-dependent dehydrogenase (short-subunit alcohol dehydrogenase family)
MKRLDGKVALITGGASGIGRAAALLFAIEGARVAVADLNDKMGKETVELAKERKLEIHFIHTDVSKVSDLEKMVKETIMTFGKLTIFWHNAGNAGPGVIENTSETDFDMTLAIHVKGGFFGAKYSMPEIKKAGGGSILFTSSISGLKASKVSPTYSMSKASLAMLTRCLAVGYAKDNIRVNCICPGAVETPLLPVFFNRDPDNSPPEAFRKRMLDSTPMGRFGKAEEIAQAALYLVSDTASFTTGLIMCVDGGFAAI